MQQVKQQVKLQPPFMFVCLFMIRQSRLLDGRRIMMSECATAQAGSRR
jgi:hypothetical protein